MITVTFIVTRADVVPSCRHCGTARVGTGTSIKCPALGRHCPASCQCSRHGHLQNPNYMWGHGR